MIRLRNVALCTVVMLGACAHRSAEKLDLREEFRTHITASSLKIFDYQLIQVTAEQEQLERELELRSLRDRNDRLGQQQAVEEQEGENGGARRRASIDRMILISDEKLKAKLAQTGYCRDGFLLLQRDFEFGQARLRGECRESANESDRARYANAEQGQSGSTD